MRQEFWAYEGPISISGPMDYIFQLGGHIKFHDRIVTGTTGNTPKPETYDVAISQQIAEMHIDASDDVMEKFWIWASGELGNKDHFVIMMKLEGQTNYREIRLFTSKGEIDQKSKDFCISGRVIKREYVKGKSILPWSIKQKRKWSTSRSEVEIVFHDGEPFSFNGAMDLRVQEGLAFGFTSGNTPSKEMVSRKAAEQVIGFTLYGRESSIDELIIASEDRGWAGKKVEILFKGGTMSDFEWMEIALNENSGRLITGHISGKLNDFNFI